MPHPVNTYERHGFLIIPVDPTRGGGFRWRGYRVEDGQSFRTDTLRGAFVMARAHKEVGAWD